MASSVIIQSLATKYRPQVLSDLVGQEAVQSQLQTFVKSKRWPNALLICGDSGCGKTTASHLIARYLNCQSPAKDGTPCGECESCQLAGGHPDVCVYNIADTRGIDDIRGMIQASRSAPRFGGKRIMLLDEAHALTPQAAEALLVPLENPSKHTLWILSTTNPEKLKPTIRGRCRILAIKRVAPEPMKKRLARITRLEKFKTDGIEGWDKVIDYIVELSNGQLRDAIEMLDTAIGAFIANPKASYRDVLTTVLSTPEAELDALAAELLLSVLTRNTKAAFKSVKASGSPRGLINKTRWLVEYVIDKMTGDAKFTPYSGKLFMAALDKHNKAADEKLKISLLRLSMFQQSLLLLEQRLNSMSIDETVAMRADLGTFIASQS